MRDDVFEQYKLVLLSHAYKPGSSIPNQYFDSCERRVPALLRQGRWVFLAITASNLEEFFMKRIGGLKQQAASGVRAFALDGRTPQELIAQCLEVIKQQEKRQREILVSLLEQLSHPVSLCSSTRSYLLHSRPRCANIDHLSVGES